MSRVAHWLDAAMFVGLVAILCLTIASLFGCAPVSGSRAPQPAGYPVESYDGCINVNRCPGFEHYRRPDDPDVGPVYWATTDRGHLACPVPPEVFTLLRDGVPLRCDWRSWRP